MTTITESRDPRFAKSIPAPRLDMFQFEDTHESEDGFNAPFLAKGEYCSDPDSFGYIVELCEVTITSNDNPDSIRESVREAMLAHFNTKKITYNCEIQIL